MQSEAGDQKEAPHQSPYWQRQLQYLLLTADTAGGEQFFVLPRSLLTVPRLKEIQDGMQKRDSWFRD